MPGKLRGIKMPAIAGFAILVKILTSVTYEFPDFDVRGRPARIGVRTGLWKALLSRAKSNEYYYVHLVNFLADEPE